MGLSKEFLSGIAADLAAIGDMNPRYSVHREKEGKSPHILPTNKERAVYEYFRAIYPPGVIVTEGFLRSIVCLPSNQAISQLNFFFTQNQQSQQSSVNFSTQNQLALSDIFQTMEFKFYYLTAPAAVTGAMATGAISNPAIPFSVLTPEYFNNGQIFSGAVGANGYTEEQALEAPYNNWLYVKLEETVYFQNYPMSGFKQPGQSQEGVAVSTASNGTITQSSESADKMKKPVTPIIELTGPGKNQWQVQMQDSVIMSPSVAGSGFFGAPPLVRGYTNSCNYVVMELHGLLCQNGMQFHNRGDRS